MAQKKVIIAFVPVLHEGYRRFFENHKDAEMLYIFGKDLIEKEFPHLQKEIRALDPNLMEKAIRNLEFAGDTGILGHEELQNIEADEIVLPDEDVSRDLAEKYLKGRKVGFEQIFLRWDKHKSMEEKPIEADQKISREEFDEEVIQRLKVEAERSSDIWRRIGAAILRDGKIIFRTYNKALPSEHSPFTFGDPRNNFHKGVNIESSLFLHAEAALISEAARKGESLDGASMYVTVFPCPPCAKLIANSGIKKLYYSGGYTVLDQDKVLRDKGVEIIYVDMK